LQLILHSNLKTTPAGVRLLRRRQLLLSACIFIIANLWKAVVVPSVTPGAALSKAHFKTQRKKSLKSSALVKAVTGFPKGKAWNGLAISKKSSHLPNKRATVRVPV